MSDLDLVEFARRVLRVELWPHQLAAAQSTTFVTTVAAARRTGKTVLAECMAAEMAMSHSRCRVLVISATEDSARRIIESLGTRLARSPVASARAAVVDATSMRIRVQNGSEIIGLPASARQIRGYGEGVLLVILDEAGFMASELWTAAHYTALDERAHGSRVLMLGTPWGPWEHFFRQAFVAGVDGDPDHASHHWSHEVNPALDGAYLERMRSRVSPAEFAAEVLGEWSDATGALFSRALIESCTADIELPALADLVGPARPILAVDIGVSFDRSATVLVYRVPVAELNRDREPVPTFVAIPHVFRQGAPMRDVVDLVVTLQAPVHYFALEVNGVGAFPAEEIERRVRSRPTRLPVVWHKTFTTSRTKMQGYGTVLGLMEGGRMVLPRHPDLLRQLAGLRFEQGERGMRIEAENAATHDDVADCLMLASLIYTPPGGRMRSALLGMADRDRAPADAVVPALDEPVVTTGAGLRIYRRPPLQSVAGRDLTLPVGARPREHAEIRPDPRLDEARARVREVLNNDARRTMKMTPTDALDPGPGGDFPFAPRLPDGSPDPVRFPTGVHRHRDPKTRRW